LSLQGSVQEALSLDGERLVKALALDPASARVEIQYLLQQVLHTSRAKLLAYPDYTLQASERLRYQGLLQRRLAGEPIAYILGEREFYGLRFKVTPATLIPRPETELLVELALERLPQGGRVLDLGTGCGAIALSIAHARPDVEVTAVDASTQALEVTQENARQLKLCNVHCLRSEWFSALAGERFDLIVSNPPYIAEGDSHLQQGDLRFEPRSALASGADGLDDIRIIIRQAKDYLVPGGWLLFEHGYDQASRARELLQAGGFNAVFSARDLAGIERASGGAA